MKKTILIIDDDPIVRMIIQQMIQFVDQSVQSQTFENGALGLSFIKSLENTSDDFIILLDINMPVLDGWGFLDGLNTISPEIISKIQLYVVTSSTDKNDQLKATSYKMVDKVYHKPLSKQDLTEILK